MNQSETSKRKLDHIDLALQSQILKNDLRFYYEPIFNALPSKNLLELNTKFGDFNLNAPMWVSSMTGGTEKAKLINQNLAKACGKYKLGMGLGSCRIILDDDTYLSDFKLRAFIGDDQPIFANLGIAQIEQLIEKNQVYKIKSLIEKTETNGLIVHINPLQEWIQTEGDLITKAPLNTIKELINLCDFPIIVKEVGQGFGPSSILELLKLPLFALDFGAFGGTNFSKVELLRNQNKNYYNSISQIGHTAEEMVQFCNSISEQITLNNNTQLIISGGIKDFLDGYYFIKKSKIPAIYGQASAFLKHAQQDVEQLYDYIESQIKGLVLADTYLKLK